VFLIDHVDSRDVVKALELQTGREKWRYEYEETDQDVFGFARSTPTIRAARSTRSAASVSSTASTPKPASPFGAGTSSRTSRYASQVGRVFLPGRGRPEAPGLPRSENAAVVALDKDTGKTICREGQRSHRLLHARDSHARRQAAIFMYLFTLVEGIDATTARSLDVSMVGLVGSQRLRAGRRRGFGLCDQRIRPGCALLDLKDGQPKPKWDNKSLESEFSSPCCWPATSIARARPESSFAWTSPPENACGSSPDSKKAG